MSKIEQFDLFLPKPSETDFLKADIEELKELIHRVRKGQYAKIGEIKKLQIEILERMDILERNICRGQK